MELLAVPASTGYVVPSGTVMVDERCRVPGSVSDADAVVVRLVYKAHEGCGPRLSVVVWSDRVTAVRDADGSGHN